MPEKTTSVKQKFKIVGSAFIVVSALKTELIKKLSKYNPAALAITEDRDGESVEIFRIATGSNSNFSKYGITYGSTNNDGYAVATVTIPEGTTDKKAYVKEHYGEYLLMLTDLEAAATTSYAALETKLTEIDALIDIDD